MDNRTANIGLQYCSKVRENVLLNLNVVKTTNHFWQLYLTSEKVKHRSFSMQFV